ncbi:nucleotidyltransferase family protein [Gordonia sp. NPDC003424]
MTATSRDRRPFDLAALRARRDEVLRVAARWGAHDVRVFGSVARGEQHEGSDIDLLVTFEEGRSLLDQVHLIDELRERLGTAVDVVAEGGLLPRDRRILAESVPL